MRAGSSHIIPRTITDGFGGKLWWAMTVGPAGISIRERGYYGIKGVAAECQSGRPEHYVHTQPGLEPSAYVPICLSEFDALANTRLDPLQQQEEKGR